MDLLTLMTSVVPSRDISFTITVIVAGLGVVLSTLLLLIIVFYAFGTILSKTEASKKKKKAKKQENDMKAELAKATAPTGAPAVQAPAPNTAPAVEQGISGEVVAAISAAIYSMEGSGATIRSISRKKSPIASRNPWAQAAINDNTRPF